MTKNTAKRRFIAAVAVALAIVGFTFFTQSVNVPEPSQPETAQTTQSELALQALGRLAVRERMDHTGYSRSQFGAGWAAVDGCDTRNRILQRDLDDEVLADDGCTVLSGILKNDPYTGKTIPFQRGPDTSSAIQIDHVVALSNAWQTGARALSPDRRREFANDPLNLLATDGPTNMAKSDKDAADWLPPNKDYHCRYIARQIAVKLKYLLWITQAELNAMKRTLALCTSEILPS